VLILQAGDRERAGSSDALSRFWTNAWLIPADGLAAVAAGRPPAHEQFSINCAPIAYPASSALEAAADRRGRRSLESSRAASRLKKAAGPVAVRLPRFPAESSVVSMVPARRYPIA
jgi:hypothetical protein